MEAEADDASADSPARRVLIKQEQLIEADLQHRRWQIAAERAGLAIKALLALAGFVAVAAAGIFVWSAAQVDGIVVEPFDTPPAMAQQGLTGSVVAAQVLDRLKAMQEQTSTPRAPATYGSGWGESIRVAIPNTGVSIGELRRYLVSWLGHETRVGGDVFQAPDGQLRVTVRVGAAPGETAAGPPAALDDLLSKSAEVIYKRSQPYLYSRWLAQHERGAEGDAILQRLLSEPEKTDRLWALNSLAGDPATPRDVQRRYIRAALRLDPDFTPALARLVGLETNDGHIEEGLRLRGELKAKAALYRRQVKRSTAIEQLAINDAYLNQMVGDYRAAARDALGTIEVTGTTAREQAYLMSARHSAFAHDLPAARRTLDQGGLNGEALAAKIEAYGPSRDPRLWERQSIGDWAAFAELAAPALADPKVFPYDRAFLAIALAKAGRIDEARSAVAPLPDDDYYAAAARAVVASFGGSPAEADALFRKAITMAPSVPHAYAFWAEALLRRGDAGGAVAQAKRAEVKGPRWPDPLMTEGEALVALGQPEKALRAYAAAAERAPNWGALQLAWGEALHRLGRTAQARAKWAKAMTLDLSPGDRARTQRLLAGSPAH